MSDPAAFPIGSLQSRAAARQLLNKRRTRPANEDDVRMWHNIKGAHRRMRESNNPCCTEKKCQFCGNEKPPAFVSNRPLGSLADAIREKRQRVNTEVSMLNSILSKTFEGAIYQ